MNIEQLQNLAADKLAGKQKAGPRVERFRALHDAQKLDQKFIDMKYELGMSAEAKEQFRQVKLPTAKELLDTFVSHVPLANPVIDIIPAKENKTYKEKADKQREFGYGVLGHSMQQTENFLIEGLKFQGSRGEVFLKLVVDSAALASKEGDDEKITERYLERLPFKLVAVDPINCYPHDTHIDCHPFDMIEIYTALAGDIRAQFPEWKGNKADNVPVRVVEYWSKTEKGFMADNIPILGNGIVENPLGFVPYVHTYSGIGYPDDDNSPQSKAFSLIRSAHEIIRSVSRFHSYYDKAIAFASMPMMGLPGTRGEHEKGGKKLVPHPGMVYFMGDYGGEKPIVSWAAPGMPDGLVNAIMLYDRMLGKVQPEVLRGEAPKGVEAGYPMELLIGQARLLFGVPMMNYQVAVGRALEMIRWLIRDGLKQTLAVWGKSQAIRLSPSDCDGVFRVTVKFESSTPAGMMNEALGLDRLRTAGGISLQTELELNPLIKNPGREQNLITAEQLARHPVSQRRMVVEAHRALYGAQEALLVEQEMAGAEEGAERKAESSGVPMGGRTETPTPEAVIAQRVLGRRGTARRGES